METKSIMELCSSIGIVPKGGSALASISDEEAIRLREELARGTKSSERISQNVSQPEPPKRVVERKVPTLPSKPKKPVAEPVSQSVSAPPPADVSVKPEEVERPAREESHAPAEKVEKTEKHERDEVRVSNEAALVSDEAVQTTKVEESAGKPEVETKQETTPVQESIPPQTPSDAVEVSAPADRVEAKDHLEETPSLPQKVVALDAEAAQDSAPKVEAAPQTDVPEKQDVAEPVSEGAKVDSERKTDSGRDTRRHEKNDRTDRHGKDASGRKNRERRRGPAKGSSPSSTPLGKKLGAREEPARPHGLSVAEEIARLGQSAVPVPPTRPAEFPSLHNPRTMRHGGSDLKDKEKENKDTPKEEKHRDEQKGSPAFRLAPVPAAKVPPVSKKREPVAQKPEVRLSADAIRATRSGDDSIIQELIAGTTKPTETTDGRSKDGTKTRAKGKERDKDRDKDRDRSKDRDKDKDRNRDKDRGKPEDRTSERKPRRPGDKPRVSDAKGTRMPPPLEEATGRPSKKMPKSKSPRRGDETSQEPPKDSRLGNMKRRGRTNFTSDDDEEEMGRIRWRKSHRSATTNTAAPRKSNIVLQLPLDVRTFADGIGVSSANVLGKLLMELKMPLTVTSPLDETTAQLLADSFGIPVEIRQPKSLEEILIHDVEESQSDDPEDLVLRPPVVTFLGHVDHGKTSLLDKIININVVSGEKGGITQHIRAYNVKYQDKSVTFVDTPGHEAFTEMRARGANCTDIAVIVVAADDGVMPQTEEAISHAKAAGVPIIVALNKIDLPGVNEMRILQELSTNDLTPSEWGGDVEVVRCSALTGQGIDELMETILMLAELHEFKANPKRRAKGVCLESSVQQGRGVVAKVLVQNGTLHTGDVIVCGSSHGRVKVMVDTLDLRQKYTEAGPAIPVNILGLDTAPGAGDKFHVLEDIADARRVAEERAEVERQSQLAGKVKTHVTLEGLFDSLGSQEVQTLNVILRTDVRGSIEAIRKELEKLKHDEVQIRILQASVGGVTEADVQLADASDAIIVGFNVVPDENARVLAEKKGVQIRRYDIIYNLTGDIKNALEGMLKPEEQEKELGRVLVKQTFQIAKIGVVAGCRVIAGVVTRDCRVRIVRNSRIIGTYAIDTLRREKDDVKEVRDGYECGIRLAGFNDVKEGDMFIAFQIETVHRTF
ncbi:MAG: translation initiation factor IF-2 [Planctomycetia bacterium]|nr:translation initiation factor IF-2 [Planctomycetia bacterium]